MATKALVGKKVGMTQVWDDDNRVVPVTVVEVSPCRIVQVKTVENDGYAPGAEQVALHELLARLQVGTQTDSDEAQVLPGGEDVAPL